MARHDISFTGQATTLQKKFGNTSWYFNGTTDYASISGLPGYDFDVDFDFLTLDFTIDFWFSAPANVASYPGIISTDTSPTASGWRVGLGDADQRITFGGLTSDTDYTPDTWTHVAIVRKGTSLKIYQGGVVVASGTAAFTYSSVSGQPLVIGRKFTNTTGGEWTGYIDELRISKGIARWDSAFMPNDLAYAPDGMTVLLCHCEGDRLASNANTVDYSGVAFSGITVPTEAYKGSMRVGPTAYAKVGVSKDWDFGAGDFTVDAWVYGQGVGDGSLVSAKTAAGSGWRIVMEPAGFGLATSSSLIYRSNDMTTGWNHIAVARRGTSLNTYLNGVAGTPVTDSTALIADVAAGGLFIGPKDSDSVGVSADTFNGYITGLRVTKGLARWTANFSIPNTPYATPAGGVDGYTKLMLHFDKGNNSNVFEDSSINTKTVSSYSAVQSNAQMVFGKSCLNLTGSNYISVGASTDLDLSGDFTLDFWFKGTTTSSHVIYLRENTSTGGFFLVAVSVGASTSTITFNYLSTNNSTWIMSFSINGTVPTLNLWTHWALTRSGSTWTGYVNGNPIGSSSDGTGVAAHTGPVDIGRAPSHHTIGVSSAVGYLDELRLSKGPVRWSSAFTPNTRPYSQPNVDSDTKLLLHMDGSNSTSTILDASPAGSGLATTYGGIVHRVSASKFGPTSLLFDGLNDFISFPDSANWQFTSDFTYDVWVYFNNTTPTQSIISQTDGSKLCSWLYDTTNKLKFFSFNGSSYIVSISCPFTPEALRWYHLALVRKGNVWSMYVDGKAQVLTLDSGSYSGVLENISGLLYIGSSDATAQYFNGHMQELRISKNTARWSYDFAPPAKPYGS